jgi:hypothetical protein
MYDIVIETIPPRAEQMACVWLYVVMAPLLMQITVLLMFQWFRRPSTIQHHHQDALVVLA